MRTPKTPLRLLAVLLMAALLLSIQGCAKQSIRPSEPPKPPVVDCEQPPRDPTLPDPPAVNDQLQWSLGWAQLLAIIGLERGDRRLEHECIDGHRKRGDIR